MRGRSWLAAGLTLAAAHAGAPGAAIDRGAPPLTVVTPRGVVVLAGGHRIPLPGSIPGDEAPAWSSTGLVALSRSIGRDREIVVVDPARGRAHRVTRDPKRLDVTPAWSPDGRRLAWASGRAGDFDIHVAGALGGAARTLVGTPADERDPHWAPDGSEVVYATNAMVDFDLHAVPVAGGPERIVVSAPGDQRDPAWSRSGLLAFTSSTGSRGDVFVAEPDGEPLRLTALPGTEAAPAWTDDGSSVLFARSRGRVWSVPRGGGAPVLAAGSVPGDRAPVLTHREFPGVGPPPADGLLLPDLDQRAPAGLVLRSGGGRTFLGFDSAVDNIGTGPLRIRGRRSAGEADMRADQAIDLRGGGAVTVRAVGRLDYEPHGPHRHWHLEPFERYELRSAVDHTLVARDVKSGFCLTDRWGNALAPVRVKVVARFVGDCGQGRPDARAVEQGSSPGFTDRYRAHFHGQEIDVTAVPAGVYVLVHRANPQLRLIEARYDNDTASVLIRLDPAARTVRVLRRCQGTEWCRPLSPDPV